MRNDSTLTLGLVGCGWVTEVRHLPALRGQPGVEVTALADVDESRLNIVADKFRIGRRHVGYRSLILDSTVDAVGICVPTPYHAEVAEAALEAGKHVFIEKPLALTLEQCDRLIERASMFPHLNVMVGFNLRWHCLVRRARQLLRQGKIGIVELVRSALASDDEAVSDWRKRRETGGGSLLEQGVHHIDLWRFLLDSDVDEVYAVSRSTVEVEVYKENGPPTAVNEVGEIAVKSATAIKGYEDADEANRESFSHGYFFTGDLGRRDHDGLLYLVGRKKLLVNKAGYKINPREIEELLEKHPKVEEVLVLGVPTPWGDEKLKAIVILGRPCTEEELVAYCRSKIATFKAPRIGEFAQQLPKTATGKIRRAMLAEYLEPDR